MDIGRILPGIAILSGQVDFMIIVMMTMMIMMVTVLVVDGHKLPRLELHLYLLSDPGVPGVRSMGPVL